MIGYFNVFRHNLLRITEISQKTNDQNTQGIIAHKKRIFYFDPLRSIGIWTSLYFERFIYL